MAERLPHYTRDYRRFVSRLLATHADRDLAMSQAVGGGYDTIGPALADLVVQCGLKPGDYLIDVGCGSGRLTGALHRRLRDIGYLGTDVVPELLHYARERFGGEGWRFVEVGRIAIPEADGVADVVVFFSVFTHLTRREQLAYLREARRVLKPGGRVVVSYIDLKHMRALQTARFVASYMAHHLFGRAFKSVAGSEAGMRRLAAQVGMTAEFLGPVIGQSVCVFSPA